jgi:predicted O-methyltransferase YrrM
MELCHVTRAQGWAMSDNEIWEIASRVQELNPCTRILEIGVQSGKSLRIWEAVADSQATLVGVDLGDNTSEQYFEKRPAVVVGDSRSSETLDKVKALLPVVDFLFIDGDHAYESVSSDFRMYSPLVRSGGLVGFHDINIDEVALFFNSVPLPKSVWRDGYGIGLVQIP